MTNVEALKALYTALGGSADISDLTTIVSVCNAIADLLNGEGNATINPDAIAAIAEVAGAALPHLEDKSVDPSTTEQTITHGSSYNGLGTVTVKAVTAAIDANIVAGNIKNGVTILGVEGTYTGA